MEATIGSSETTLRLSVVVPTGGDWGDLAEVVASLLPAVETLGVEVVAVSGCGGRPAAPVPGVRYLAEPEPDVFRGRAAAVAVATGDVVALVEDHQRVHPGWAPALLDAWRAHPNADALVHSMTTHADAGAWETALFIMTSGPFLAVDELPSDRLPVPGIVSFRRSLLGEAPMPGFMEYELLAGLQAQARIAMVDVPAPVHVQPVGWRAPMLAFHSARMFAGTRAAASVGRVPELRRMVRDVRVVRWQTVAARRRTNAGALGALFVLCCTALLAMQVVGQSVGILTRSTGSSARHLE